MEKGLVPEEQNQPRKNKFLFDRIDSARLPAESAQILIAFRDAVERILGPVMLDDIVLDPGLVGLRENLLPVDDAVANRSQVGMIAKVLPAPG